MVSKEKFVDKNSRYYIITPPEDSRLFMLYPLIVGNFTYLPGYHQRRLSYDSFLLMLIKKGSLQVYYEDQVVTLSSGQYVLIDCYKPHEYGSNDGCEILWLHFDGKSARDYFDYINSKHLNYGYAANFSSMTYSLGTIFVSYDKSQEPIDMATAHLYITTLYNEILHSSQSLTSNKNPGILKTLQYIELHYNEEISIQQLSELASLSLHYFIRAFKKETGVSPHQYVIDTRISSAKYNLVNTNMTVSEIAYEVGFKDESAFCYTFRKREGLTPTQFRQQVLQDQQY